MTTDKLSVELGQARLTLAIKDQKCVNHGQGKHSSSPNSSRRK